MRDRILAAERFDNDIGDIILGEGQIRQEVNDRCLLDIVALLCLEVGLDRCAR